MAEVVAGLSRKMLVTDAPVFAAPINCTLVKMSVAPRSNLIPQSAAFADASKLFVLMIRILLVVACGVNVTDNPVTSA